MVVSFATVTVKSFLPRRVYTYAYCNIWHRKEQVDSTSNKWKLRGVWKFMDELADEWINTRYLAE
ncbi:hypothetical protein SAMN04244560_01242 [Thermoanaerobacter thermohydrosulfuricus]|uniref:Uncharacterized protein n=1 Tax=Thermoanaerobacter thermohydrosulfuricus TaxID=1516 RepID=A0A1G7NZ69_THETY|nr:hypothetical protein [Thermoanaerobacter thermohydrosulfuricus]SDF79346.1 hypothetical protein SAMN04244560_01242 [Thermoanaerobacter thermohydrosulfuricus]